MRIFLRDFGVAVLYIGGVAAKPNPQAPFLETKREGVPNTGVLEPLHVF